MEKVKIIKKQKEQKNYEFYCDECQKFLGISKEYDDGYYEEIGQFQQSVYTEEYGWFTLEKCFCDKCKQKFIKRFKEILLELGFKSEEGFEE